MKEIADAPSECEGYDLLQFRDIPRSLGPFDGNVAAFVRLEGILHFITTNATYVPRPPSHLDRPCLRRDMRWGPDDPTLWPQLHSEVYCHLGSIPRRPQTSASISDIMWWSPSSDDFVSPNSDRTLTLGLGKLDQTKITEITQAVRSLLKLCTRYLEFASSDDIKSTAILKRLVDSLNLALDRLRSIPATYERLVSDVANIQRTYLEVSGFLDYMILFRPWMHESDRRGGCPGPDVGDRIGVFTKDPAIAQRYHRARLPYWLIRPLTSVTLDGVKILRVVALLEPGDFLELGRADRFCVLPTGLTVEERVGNLHAQTTVLPWYRNPYKPQPSSLPSQTIYPEPSFQSSRPSARAKHTNNKSKLRLHPYMREQNKSDERDKYSHFDHEYMADPIPSWASALAAVDRSQQSHHTSPSRNQYAFPESALLANSTQRDLYFRSYQHIRDALLYRIGDVDAPPDPLSPAEWRQVLRGNWSPQGAAKRTTRKLTDSIHRLLGPALKACGIDPGMGLEIKQETKIAVTVDEAKQITWELAEMNFRTDLCALDELACSENRHEECLACFPSGGLIPDASEAATGFAADSPFERLPNLLSLAKLMSGWRTDTPRPKELDSSMSPSFYSTPQAITELEEAVAKYYTQTFFEFHGRAAVVPLRFVSGRAHTESTGSPIIV
ncbi:hypothetical protein R3P38DRAFT_3230787 [Favolaschia claudopus]|uniref:Uncharacterized protein n=1 Tax=Favolaschia claudopus TaxID=2862362 RepID=A0AAV9ZLN3_9AGAR